MSSVNAKPFLWVAAFIAWAMLFPLSATAQDAGKPDSPPNVLEGQKLVEALRAGGYVIYFRHGISDLSTYDTDRDNLKNCATQRALSQEGRRQMRAIGEAIKALGIRVSAVLSSPYCRSIDTAKLAFGRADIAEDLKHTVTAEEDVAARQAQALRNMLATAPGVAGTNTVLSGHSGNLQEATEIWPKPEGVAIIFKPEANGKFSYIATVPPTYWQELVRKEHASAGR
jgi:phosphohistidine phosphatase SixA